MDVVAIAASDLPEDVRATLGGDKDGTTVVAGVVFSMGETIDSVGDGVVGDVVAVHGVTVITVVVSILIVIEQSVADIASVEITDNDDDDDDDDDDNDVDDDDDDDAVVAVDVILAPTSLDASSFKDLASGTTETMGCVSGHSVEIIKIKFARSW